MARLPRLTPDVLDEDQRRLYHDITTGPRAGSGQQGQLTGSDGALAGPFNAMLLRPVLGSALQQLGAAIRYQGVLTGISRELAILVVAARWQSTFEQQVHEDAARGLGATGGVLATIRAGREPQLADPAQAATVRAAMALAHAGDLDDQQYAEVVAALGADGLFELTTLVGYYATLALQLRVFRAGGPPEPPP
jgi:4-carboxymuconolactone decarboxylase